MPTKWNVCYASHLGYIDPEEPLFRELVNSRDPWDHVAFAAHLGFKGVLYPWALGRPEQEVTRFREALYHFGLSAGCTVLAPRAEAFLPIWTEPERTDANDLDARLDKAIFMAESLGSKTIVSFLVDTGEPVSLQEAGARERLLKAGDRVSRRGLVLGLEHMVLVPGLLHTTTDRAATFLEAVDHSAVRMVFDTGHVQMMDGDVLQAYRRARDVIALMQLADMPLRVAPLMGEIDFTALLTEAKVDGNLSGLIELEHGWPSHSREIEHQGIELLRQIDARLAAPT